MPSPWRTRKLLLPARRSVVCAIAGGLIVALPLAMLPASDLGAATPASTITSSVAAPTQSAPGPTEVTGPVGTLPDGSFPPGVDVIAQLPELKTADSNTYLTSSGSKVLMSYPGPVNYLNSSGAFEPIDNTATTSSSGGWMNTAGLYSASVPPSLNGNAVSVTSGTSTVAMTLDQSSSAGGTNPTAPSSASGVASGSAVSFSQALPDATVSYAFGNTGLEETLSLSAAGAPTSYTWSVSGTSGLMFAQTPTGSIDVNNAMGSTVMVIDTPTIEDANDIVGPTPSLSLSASGTSMTIDLTPDAQWLADPARAFPVSVDPTISTTLSSGTECELIQSVPTSTNCAGNTSYVVGYNGYTDNAHSLFSFTGLTSAVPYDSLVQSAYFDVYEQGTSGTGTVPMVLNTVENKPWTTSATWNDYNSTSGLAWTTHGGDYVTTPGTSAQNAGGGNGWFDWSPVQQVQTWVNGTDLTGTGQQSANEGFLIAADGAPNSVSLTNWASATTSHWPYLALKYTSRIGTSSPLSILKASIDDKTTLGVNAANGDLSVSSSLFNIQGVGVPLSIGQNYDSQGAVDTSMGDANGAGWALSSSFDQPLLAVQQYGANGVVDLTADDGTNAVFTDPSFAGGSLGTFASPPGLGATLQVEPSYVIDLIFNQSQQVWSFSLIPGYYGASYHLASITDRNGDAIDYTYNTAGTELTSITDTQGRVVTIGYNANNLVNAITDSTGREVQFSYTAASGGYQLTSQTYGGYTTSYGYDSNGNLNKLTDPNGNITTMVYNSSRQVTSVTRVTNNVTLAGLTTSYSYAPGSFSAPLAGVTTVTDPRAYHTTYDYDSWDQVGTVTDADGNTQSATYNPQSDVSQLTSYNTNPGGTVLAYDNNNNLQKITSPASGPGQTPATQSLSYGDPTGVTGGLYLPTSLTDSQNNCTTYGYDAVGNLTSTISGQASTCPRTGGTGTTSSTNAYQGDGSTTCGGKAGELCKVTNGNGAVTNYAYNSLGQLTSITPPTPQGATTITYDALSRPATVTTPTSTSTYTYDVWNRITKVVYSSGPTVSYTYDADGDVTKRVDATGTTNFGFDTLDRLTTEQLPGSADNCVTGSSIVLTYDADSNLASYCDAGGTTTYNYDPGNRLSNLAQPGGSCTGTISLCTTYSYVVTAFQMEETITLPGGATEKTTDNQSGNVASIIGSAATGGTPIAGFTYSYAQGANDTQLRQTMTENDQSVANVTTTYGYDSQNRLTSAVGSASNSYSYDSVGNQGATSTNCATTGTFSYNADNEMTCDPTGTFSYDTSGEETSSPQLSNLSYNTADQTTSITPSGSSAYSLSYADVGQALLTTVGSTTLAYGPLGLASAVTGSTTTYFVHDPYGNIVGETVGTAATRYFLKDSLGSVIAVINGTGSSVRDRYAYGPYGVMTVVSGSDYEPIRYASGYHDADSLLTRFGTRYYDPSTGRWTQMDPIGGSIANPATLNGYIYAGDDPVNNVDPEGTSFFGDVLGAVSVAVGVASIVSLAFIPEVTIPIGLLAALGGDSSIAAGVYSLIGGT